MIVLAITATLCAVGLSILIIYANSMRSSPGEFRGAFMLIAAWFFALVMWMAWFFN